MSRGLLLIVVIWQMTASSAHVRLTDANGPLSGVRVTLTLYAFKVEGDQTIARPVFVASCKTDRKGECTILIGETKGMLRGSLEVGEYGKRSLLWPSGAVNVGLYVENGKLLVGTEPGPYDFQKVGDDGGMTILDNQRARFSYWAIIFVAAILMIGVTAWVYMRSRKEHS